MQSVRARAAELTADPHCLERPVSLFECPGRAKLEADAHLAVVINGLVETIVHDSEREQQLEWDYRRTLRDKYAFKPWRLIDPVDAAELFGDTFDEHYRRESDIAAAFETPFGQRAEQACRYYVSTCSRYLRKCDQDSRNAALTYSYFRYRKPVPLIHSGLLTFRNEFVRAAAAVLAAESTDDQREIQLPTGVKSAKKAASLALAQLRIYNVTGRQAAAVTSKSVDTAPNICEARQLPEHENDIIAKLRPRLMCPALPDFEENSWLSSGSGIEKLWLHASRLFVAVNAHRFGALAHERASA